jgi:hypothetical protein
MRLAGGPPSFLTREFKVASERDRRRMLKHLRAGLARLEERAGQPYVRVLQVQLVGQVCGSLGYESWRQVLDGAWRRQGGRFTTRN